MTHPKSFYRPVKNTKKVKDLAGKRFGRLTVLGVLGSQNRNTWWYCACDCGGETDAPSGRLGFGMVQSCGCLQKEVAAASKRTHGHTRDGFSREYDIWAGMKARCNNPQCNTYKNYGARGITVCERWVNSFENFLEDMGRCPEGWSLDRIDVNGNYEPSNCRWADRRTQANNTRNNVSVEFDGETKTLSQWGRAKGIPHHRLSWRLKNGWPIQAALHTPKLTRGERIKDLI